MGVKISKRYSFYIFNSGCVNNQSLSYTDWGPIFGGVCACALLRNREWNKRNFFVER